nr:MAG TPA: hypothetical protein [Caudoviricetes sp.]
MAHSFQNKTIDMPNNLPEINPYVSKKYFKEVFIK